MNQLMLTPEIEAAVKLNDLSTVMRLKGISHRSMVNLMQTEFKGFDSPLLSKVRNPQKYGVVLHPRGYELLEALPAKRKDNRKLKMRVYGRLTEEEYRKLLIYLEKDGYKSVQDFIRDKVQEYLVIAQTVLGRID